MAQTPRLDPSVIFCLNFRFLSCHFSDVRFYYILHTHTDMELVALVRECVTHVCYSLTHCHAALFLFCQFSSQVISINLAKDTVVETFR